MVTTTVATRWLPNTCGGCDARWAGTRTAHCRACHETFSGVSTFDAHRAGPGRPGVCIAPAEVGLCLLPERPYPCWGTRTET